MEHGGKTSLSSVGQLSASAAQCADFMKTSWRCLNSCRTTVSSNRRRKLHVPPPRCRARLVDFYHHLLLTGLPRTAPLKMPAVAGTSRNTAKSTATRAACQLRNKAPSVANGQPSLGVVHGPLFRNRPTRSSQSTWHSSSGSASAASCPCSAWLQNPSRSLYLKP